MELISKLTHDNSLVYVEVPGVNDLKNKSEYLYSYQNYNVLAHIHNFSLGTLAHVFASQGFSLVKGTEFVRAVFRKNCKKPQEYNINNYKETITALEEARQKHLDYMKWANNPMKKYLKGVAKALLGRF